MRAASGRSEASGKRRAAQWPPRGPVRLLIVVDRLTLADLIRLTLNHGLYMTRVVSSPAAAAALLDNWQPHLLIFDADLDGQQLMQHVKH